MSPDAGTPKETGIKLDGSDMTTDPARVEAGPVATSKVEEFKEGMPIPYGKDHNRDEVWTFKDLHNAPNKEDYKNHLLSIPVRDRLPEEKRNLKLLNKTPCRITHNTDSQPQKVVNDWHKHLKRNSECPCGSGLKWKKCHMNIMSPYVPVEAYMTDPNKAGMPRAVPMEGV